MADTNTTTPPNDPTKEIGATGTLIQNGIISSEEYNRQLIGKGALSIYEEMRRSDSNVHSALQLVKLPLMSATWDIQAAQDEEGNVSDEDKEVADFVKRELGVGGSGRKVNWIDFLRQALTMLDFGHSVFEKVYEVTDYNGKPRIGLAKLGSRKQTTIYFWETPDHQDGITQLLLSRRDGGDTGMVGIPRDKLIYFTNEKEGDNYQGISLLRFCYKDWHMKSKLTLVNAVGLEKQSVGVPKVYAKEGQTPNATDEREAEQAVQNMRANEKAYLKLPASMDVEMLDMKSSSTKDVLPTLAFHKRGIYESILATFMDLGGSSGSGSKALSGDLTGFFFKAEEAIANVIVETLSEELIHQLCDMNFSNLQNGYPKLTFGSVADDDNTLMATAVAALTTAGLITPDPDLEDDLRSRFRFPRLPEELREINEDKGDGGADDAEEGDEPDAGTTDTSGTDPTKLDKETKAALRASQYAKRKLIKVEFRD